MTHAASPDRGSGSGQEPDFDLPTTGGQGEGRHDRVLVPEERAVDRRARLFRRLLRILALAAVVAGALYLWGDVIGERTRTVVDEVVPPEARPWGEPDPASPGANPGGERAAEGPGLRALRERARDLDQAIGRFGERAADHRLGRLDCEGLARGYEEVDRAMVELARAYVAVRQRAADEHEALYEGAMARADSAGRVFDRTGCRRGS